MMKAIGRIDPLRAAMLLGALASCLLAGCNESGDGTDPFNIGGGASSLVGKWTSASATGTVAYGTSELGVALANAVNENIQTYILNDVVTFTFETGGTVKLLDMGTLYTQGTYSLKGNTLTLTNQEKQTLNLTIALKETEFTLDASGTEIAALAVWAIGDAVLRANNYGGMTETGLEVTVADLTMKFVKQ
ncbi:MAG: lipocalin family protein [Tannerellaceae bacterium]|jgi:hypothetical protein|nr:lipocalin family protein [Tannerellaceae bacterium]